MDGSLTRFPAFPVSETRVSGRRALAHLVDGIVLGVIVTVPWLLAGQVSRALALAVFVISCTVAPIVYYVLTQRRTGRSPGKRLTRIRVVDAMGATPSVGALIRRSIPVVFEWFYVLGFAAMALSPYRQRLGDRWGRTYVVRDHRVE